MILTRIAARPCTLHSAFHYEMCREVTDEVACSNARHFRSRNAHKGSATLLLRRQDGLLINVER
ncbi:MAG TPA: hypothetical protein PKH51_00455 [Candidatus Sumerlaeota bacterium]|nr:hypothetical protein [Candidatus Sumerlaeota bacterium]